MPDESPIQSGPRRDSKRSRGRQDSVKRERPADTTVGEELAGSAVAENIGAVFRRAREAQGLSQDQVANLTTCNDRPISRTTISAIERGRYLPNLEALASLSRVLSVDPLEVIERVDLAPAAPLDLTGVTIEELRSKAEEFFWSGNYRSALSIYDAMLEQLVLHPPDDPEEHGRRHAQIEIYRATTLRQCSALKAARTAAERAIELSRGVPEQQAEAYIVLASLLSHEGLLELAHDVAERAVAMADGGSNKLQGQAWSQKGSVLHRAREFERARGAFLHARKFAIEAGDHHNLIVIEGTIGACLVDMGRASQARTRFAKAVELARKHSDRAAEAFWLVEFGRLALEAGDHEDADRAARSALRIAKPADRVLTIFRAEWLRHLIVRERQPGSADRHRIAYLKKLYRRVQDHKSLDVIKEFEETVLGSSTGRRPT